MIACTLSAIDLLIVVFAKTHFGCQLGKILPTVWCFLHRVFERDGVKLVCDDISFDFLKGATVEFEEDLIKSAFQVSVQLTVILKTLLLS